MKVLLVKLTSMGDLIHALPALSDAGKAIPDIEFHWVVEESFSQVASWHKNVSHIIKSAHRRWRKNFIKSYKAGEFGDFWRRLRHDEYDVVIDGQSSFKSALVTRFTRGYRVGMDARSVREYGAHWFYQKRIFVDKEQHALPRLRQLFSRALNYEYDESDLDFGIARDRLDDLPFTPEEKYLVFVPNASWETKQWPESYWQALIEKANTLDLPIYLPWGNAEEEARAQRLAETSVHAHALPKLSLSQVAVLLMGAAGTVCCDTGLAHLSAAVGAPTVTLYGPTNPKYIGTVGHTVKHRVTDFACASCKKMQCHYKGQKPEVMPACFSVVTPEQVFGDLQGLLK